MNVTRLTALPTPWNDPVLAAPLAASLLAQPHHYLLHNGAHVLVRLVPGAAGDIVTLFTPPSLRRQGLAAALLHEVIALARTTGCPNLLLEVRVSNSAAIALYEQVGFTRATVRPAYYTNPVEVAVVYQVTL